MSKTEDEDEAWDVRSGGVTGGENLRSFFGRDREQDRFRGHQESGLRDEGWGLEGVVWFFSLFPYHFFSFSISFNLFIDFFFIFYFFACIHTIWCANELLLATIYGISCHCHCHFTFKVAAKHKLTGKSANALFSGNPCHRRRILWILWTYRVSPARFCLFTVQLRTPPLPLHIRA